MTKRIHCSPIVKKIIELSPDGITLRVGLGILMEAVEDYEKARDSVGGGHEFTEEQILSILHVRMQVIADAYKDPDYHKAASIGIRRLVWAEGEGVPGGH